MRFLPVFLDLQSGPILLLGAGELVRAKLRLLLAAGARVRWYPTDGNRDVLLLELELVGQAAIDQVELLLHHRLKATGPGFGEECSHVAES